MKLVSMTEFILSLNNTANTSEEYGNGAFLKCARYAKFISQPLTLGMFVPCDEDGNVLEEPKQPDKSDIWNDSALDSQTWANYQYQKDKYNEAKERVLFEGFKIVDKTFNENTYHYITSPNGMNYYFCSSDNCKTWEINNLHVSGDIESLIHFDLTLTQSAIKQLGL